MSQLVIIPGVSHPKSRCIEGTCPRGCTYVSVGGLPMVFVPGVAVLIADTMYASKGTLPLLVSHLVPTITKTSM